MRASVDEVRDIQCSSCEKFYSVCTRVVFEFDSVGDCKKNKQMPHQLKKGWTESSPYICINCKGEYYDFDLKGTNSWHLKPDEFVILNREAKDNELI